jgi:hypothetical protein
MLTQYATAWSAYFYPRPLQVALLRNYLGVILIQAFELRRLTSERALLASRAVPLDLDAKEMVGVGCTHEVEASSGL